LFFLFLVFLVLYQVGLIKVMAITTIMFKIKI